MDMPQWLSRILRLLLVFMDGMFRWMDGWMDMRLCARPVTVLPSAFLDPQGATRYQGCHVFTETVAAGGTRLLTTHSTNHLNCNPNPSIGNRQSAIFKQSPSSGFIRSLWQRVLRNAGLIGSEQGNSGPNQGKLEGILENQQVQQRRQQDAKIRG